ncbi:Flp family type IVb pilin [Mesorhizobium amorphae]|uniref:Flp family type IVb pilin n=1 Tax=Mesorhizobium amorphae TaxID=71433 RepID=UPI00391F4564
MAWWRFRPIPETPSTLGLNWSSPMMAQLLVRFVQDKSGATAIEYSLIATLIALAS